MSVVLNFCQWLGDQSASHALRDSIWTYPVVESVHVLALCLFMGFVVLLDLRLLNITLRKVPVSRVAGRLLPWTFVGFVLLAISGALLFYSDPVRFYGNVFFRAKVVMLVLAGANAWVFDRTIYQRVHEWDLASVAPLPARVAGLCSLMLWTGVVTAGRMIAYNWFK